MNQEAKIVVVGDGIAGLSLTRRLAEKEIGFGEGKITLVAPALLSLSRKENISTPTRASAPFVHHATAQELGLSVTTSPAINKGIFGIEQINPIRRLIEKIVEVSGQNYINSYPIHVIDIEVERAELLLQLQKIASVNSRINLIEGKFNRLHITDDKVTGVYIEDREEPLLANLVVDATGRPARLIKSLETKDFIEKRIFQPSTTFSGYVDLSNPAVEEDVPGIKRKLIISMIPGGIGTFSAPIEKVEHSLATHLFLLGGNVDSIQQAIQWVQNIHYSESLEKRRLAAMIKLTEGSLWNKILLKAQSIDRTVLFTHTEAVYRKPLVQGLIAIGDAQGHVNPQAAIGFIHLAQDIKKLIFHLDQQREIPELTSKYNDEMEITFRSRFIKSQIFYQSQKILHQLLGTRESQNS